MQAFGIIMDTNQPVDPNLWRIDDDERARRCKIPYDWAAENINYEIDGGFICFDDIVIFEDESSVVTASIYSAPRALPIELKGIAV